MRTAFTSLGMQSKPYLREISLERSDGENLTGYPFDIPAVAKLGRLKFHADVTFFVGENGTGKSTILEAIALALGFGPEGGTKNMLFQNADTISPLHNSLRTVRSHRRPEDWFFLRAESFYNMATYVDEVGGPALQAYDFKSLHRRSHVKRFLRCSIRSCAATASTFSTNRKLRFHRRVK